MSGVNFEDFFVQLLEQSKNLPQNLTLILLTILSFLENQNNDLNGINSTILKTTLNVTQEYFEDDEFIPQEISDEKVRALQLLSLILKSRHGISSDLQWDTLSQKDKLQQVESNFNNVQAMNHIELVGCILKDSYNLITSNNDRELKLSLVRKAINSFKLANDTFNLSLCYSYLANLFKSSNEFEISKSYIEKSLKLLENNLENRGYLQLYSSQKMELAEIYTKFGKLTEAKKLSMEALEIETKLENYYHIPILHSNLGVISYLQNQYDDANLQFDQALSQFQKKDTSFENIVVHSWILGYKVKMALDQNDRLKASELIDDYKTILSDKLPNEMTSQEQTDIAKKLWIKLDLAKAELKIRGNRRNDKYEAEQIYNRLEPKVEDHDELIPILKGKSELLIDELRSLNDVDTEIITELNDNITKLEEIAKKDQLIPLLIETYLLRSKLMVLKKNIGKALKKLHEAKDLAKEYTLLHILSKLEKEEELINSIFKDWEDIITNNDLKQEISKNILAEYIQKAMKLSNL